MVSPEFHPTPREVVPIALDDLECRLAKAKEAIAAEDWDRASQHAVKVEEYASRLFNALYRLAHP